MATNKVTVALTLMLAILIAMVTLAQTDQGAIAQQILSTNPYYRSKALEAAKALAPNSVQPELREALIRALRQENLAVQTRHDALTRGEFVPRRMEDDFYGGLLQVVLGLRDPAAIDALTGALGTGLMVIRGLAGFGELAVQPVAQKALSAQSLAHQADDALITLRFIVEGEAGNKLSPGSRALIRRAAEQRLTGKQSPTTLWHAIDLAITLDEPDLARVVSSLANDARAVTERGVTETDLIERTQQRARDRLAGLPPMVKR